MDFVDFIFNLDVVVQVFSKPSNFPPRINRCLPCVLVKLVYFGLDTRRLLCKIAESHEAVFWRAAIGINAIISVSQRITRVTTLEITTSLCWKQRRIGSALEQKHLFSQKRNTVCDLVIHVLNRSSSSVESFSWLNGSWLNGSWLNGSWRSWSWRSWSFIWVSPRYALQGCRRVTVLSAFAWRSRWSR